MRLYLIPRLNYGFSISDLGISLLSLIRSNFNVTPLINLFKTEKIYFVNHARTGLRLLLNSLELPRNARIGIQILNCDSVFTAIVKAGYIPIFIDINEKN